MKKYHLPLLILSLLVGVLGFTPKGQAQTRAKYSCVVQQGVPRTVVETKRGKIELIVWKSTYFGSSWSPERRCQEVTKRFQAFADTGNLRYVTTGKMNGYNVICVGDQRVSGYACRRDGLLITLQPNDHPPAVMNELFNINNRVRGGGVTRGMGQRQSNIIDLDDFLQKAPLMETTTPTTVTPSTPPVIPQEPLVNTSPSVPNGVVVPEELQ